MIARTIQSPNFFIISSSGGSASNWLSSAIQNISSDILCFQGPSVSNWHPYFASSATYSEGLQKIHAETGRPAGCNHVFFANEEKAISEALGGVNIATLRSPLSRAFSLLRLRAHRFLRTDHVLRGESAKTQKKVARGIELLKRKNQDISKEHSVERENVYDFPSMKNSIIKIKALFINELFFEVTAFDHAILSGFNQNEIFRFEDYTRKSDEFYKLSRKILGDCYDKPAIETAFFGNKPDPHRPSDNFKNTLKKVLITDPGFLASSLQFCFDFAAQVTGTDLRALYERQGYNFSFPRPTRNDPEPIVDDWLTGEWRNSLEKRQLRLADDLFFPAKTSVKGGTAFLASKPT